jgi:hypothetical protein
MNKIFALLTAVVAFNSIAAFACDQEERKEVAIEVEATQVEASAE